MAYLKTILFSLTFLLLLESASAEKCPNNPTSVSSEEHAVLSRATKEMEKGRNRQALKILSDFSSRHSETPHPQFPFLKGLIEYDLKDYENAEMLFKKAIQLDPCFGEAWQNLAVVYHLQERPDKAAIAMEKAFSLITPENIDLKYQSALFELKANQPEKALRVLRELTERENPPVKWLLALARAQKSLGQTRKAAELLEKAHQKDPNPELLYEAALLRLEAKEPQKAIQLLKQVAQKPHPERSWIILLADTLAKENKPVEAASVLQKAAKDFKAPDLQYQAALFYVKGGKPEAALPLLEALGTRKNPRVQWLTALSHVYARLSNPAKAALAMERANRLKPDPDRQYRAACFWIEANQPEKALPLLKASCAKAEDRQKCRTTLIQVLERLGKTEEAAKLLAEQGPEKKSSSESFRLALLFLKEGQPQKAVPVLQKLAEHPAPDAQWLVTLAIALDQIDQSGKARTVMKRVDTNNPSLSPNLRLQMAIFWLHHDQADQALPLLEVLVKEAKASKASQIAYIEALVNAGNAKRAAPFLKQLLSRYPDDPSVWRLQAWSAIEQKDYGKAAAALEVAFRLDPPGPREWKRLGNLYRLAGIPKKAAFAYQKAFGNKPTAGDYDLLAAAYQEAHRMKKALSAALLAAKKDPTEKRFSRLGQLYMTEEDWTKGLEAFQTAAQMGDDGGTNSLRLGYAAWKLNRLDLAETAFQSALQKADPKSQTASKAAQALKSIAQLKERKTSTSLSAR